MSFRRRRVTTWTPAGAGVTVIIVLVIPAKGGISYSTLMAELKTKKTTVNPVAFIKTLSDKEKQRDSIVLLKMFADVTGEKPAMWGAAIIGYGMYHYKSERSTQAGDWFLTGFSPRKQNLTLYIHPHNISSKLLKKLGSHSKSGGCLYIKRLSDVGQPVLRQVIAEGFRGIKKQLAKSTV